jgi:hypothetical protein
MSSGLGDAEKCELVEMHEGRNRWLLIRTSELTRSGRYERLAKDGVSLVNLSSCSSACALIVPNKTEIWERCRAEKHGKWGLLHSTARLDTENHLLQVRFSLWILSRENGKFRSFVRYIRVVGSNNCGIDLLDRHVISGFVDTWDATVGSCLLFTWCFGEESMIEDRFD